MSEKKIIEKFDEVKQLEKATDQTAQIELLQKIAARLLNECVIKVGSVTIEPLLVEAYYYHDEKFRDTNVHAVSKPGAVGEQAKRRQKNNLNRLYIHRPKGDGIDICLTDSDEYYLSFLIKNALVNGEWMTQNAIAQALCDSCADCVQVSDCKFNSDVVLYEKNPPRKSEIIYLPRKGKELTGEFADAPLAALPLEEIWKHEFTLPKGYGKLCRIAIYALRKTDGNEEEARRYIKENQLYKYAIDKPSWAFAKQFLHIDS